MIYQNRDKLFLHSPNIRFFVLENRIHDALFLARIRGLSFPPQLIILRAQTSIEAVLAIKQLQEEGYERGFVSFTIVKRSQLIYLAKIPSKYNRIQYESIHYALSATNTP